MLPHKSVNMGYGKAKPGKYPTCKVTAQDELILLLLATEIYATVGLRILLRLTAFWTLNA
jgi:hypothetical protein